MARSAGSAGSTGSALFTWPMASVLGSSSGSQSNFLNDSLQAGNKFVQLSYLCYFFLWIHTFIILFGFETEKRRNIMQRTTRSSGCLHATQSNIQILSAAQYCNDVIQCLRSITFSIGINSTQ